MLPLIADKMIELTALCQKYRVARLDLFGSATTDEFDASPLGEANSGDGNSGDGASGDGASGGSDLDFIVEFEPMEPIPRKNAYFSLHRELASLFARDIDLVEDGAVRNPYICQSINASRVHLYAAA